jgi:hypothetical protein
LVLFFGKCCKSIYFIVRGIHTKSTLKAACKKDMIIVQYFMVKAMILMSYMAEKIMCLQVDQQYISHAFSL